MANDKSPQDKELKELLDSALKDFETDTTTTGNASNETEEDPPLETLDLNDEFLQQNLKVFGDQMAALFGTGQEEGQEISPEQLQLGFQRIAEAAQMAVSGEGTAENVPQVDTQFTQSISEVLKGLSAGQENLQQPFSPDDIAGMFGNVNLNESGESNPFLPFMQGMMQSLLSAEVLLPSLKDLVSRYPEWLEENGSKISAEDKTRYESQLKMMTEVVNELEKESTTDSAEVKKDRFNLVLDRMQKMQELGNPPKDLVGDVDNAIPIPDLTTGGVPDPSQCSIM